ncbi:unnamed protein product (macronuclear) [Paramecium tetraurelia]|uniref:Transmembrane protein n=1 Tax=Paramecium tetraurelia TaxID=5888 RepID=A0BIJ1_PARTE|nr:uncharacterized protein GSPATT00004730001 [Paramecium tetraurelia]CAK58358.1 unnamed protein product [Paramecium tetraurelia]|eukprot:XP_001425756.1 hypothetical protein (macronuclear) [Paramecium tetraurelia strain d4-2]
MKCSTQPQIIITPNPKYSVTEEGDELPNPMLDSILSQKSQASYSGLGKCLKLKLNSNRSDQRNSPNKLLQIRRVPSESKKESYKKQYKQMDSLLPLLKLVQLNQKQNKTECYNGEEVTIDQKIYFIKTNEILNIFQKAADGFTISYEEVENCQEEQMKQSVSVSEKMIKSMKAIKTFQKAKNKIRSFILVSDVSKYTDEEIKRKQQADKMNLFFSDNTFIQKSDHQLGEQIIKTKSPSPQKYQIGESQYFQEEKIIHQNNKAPRRLFHFIQFSKTILINTSFVVGIFLLILLLAYIKTINNYPTQMEDL